ncbi:MAG: hypothetical protein M1282_00295 [Chloroflexi bacterium]|nr:hypothetical protein [Chloroflexota bacterium]
MKKFHLTLLLIGLILSSISGCSFTRYTTSNPTPTSAALPTLTSPAPTIFPAASLTAIALTPNLPPTAISTPLPSASIPQFIVTQQIAPADFCADAQATALIANFKTALQSSDGKSLANLVSPAHGMDVRYYRDGRVVNYDQTHAQFLFDSTFQVDWGAAPGSGLETKGSFHEIILPSLLDVFNKSYTLTCDQIRVGGTTYQASWPYQGINFYSVYFPGTSANGNMDWRTWVIGMEYLGGKPYLYAIMPFQWEP